MAPQYIAVVYTNCIKTAGVQMVEDRIIAVGLLTKRDVRTLGPTFDRLWPVQETPCFSQLLQAIDDADRELIRDRDVKLAPGHL